MLENELTPYILVRVDSDDVIVPQEYVQDGQITLNLAGSATQSLELANHYVAFSARFKGVARDIYIPMRNAVAIFAKENGYGINFDSINDFGDEFVAKSPRSDHAESPKSEPQRDRPNLRLV